MLVDSRINVMNEADDDRNVVIGYRVVIADLIQLLLEQQKYRERMNG